MMNFFHAVMTETFLQHALMGGLLASVTCGILGAFVVVRRIEYLAGGIAHTVLAGMGIAYFFAASPLIGALIAAIIAALLIGWISLRAVRYEQTMVSALWSIGMAVGIIFMTKTPGYNAHLMDYLFGNVLMISTENLYGMLVLSIFIIIVMGLFYKIFVAIAFDAEFATLRGIKVNFYFLLLLCLVAMTVVMLVQVVGLILVIALLTLPAAIARQTVKSLLGMIIGAILLGSLFTVLGLQVAFVANIPAGAAIILIAGSIFLLSVSFKRV